MAKSPAQKFRKSIHTKKRDSRAQSKAEQFVWGIHSVQEALKVCPQIIQEIIVGKVKPGRRLEEIIEAAQKHAIPVIALPDQHRDSYGNPDELSEHERSQGIAARIILPYLTLDGLLHKLNDICGPPLLLALDSIQDPHNLGAIIRSAVAAGVNGIILPKDRSASITGTVIKISAGSVFHINICRVTNLVSSFKVLKEKGIWIFGTTKDADQTIYDTDLTVPACLVIGSEGKGLRPLVAEHCDLNITIPMQNFWDSLNASVAAGIILFETVRQRRVQ
jgi:23S rRNA (guanosine2251-2'-O)-methyltransferase